MVRRVREINQPLNAEGADKAYLKNRSQVSSMMSAGGSLNAQQKKLIESAFAYKLFQMTDPTNALVGSRVRLTEKSGYGNTTNTAVNDAAGMTYGDRLIWLLPAENYEKRVQVWNEVKAA